MRLLLDTHALIWWLSGEGKLSELARAGIANDANDIFVSAASAWEITTKFRLGKLPSVAGIVADLSGAIGGQGFLPLSATLRHGQAAGALPGPHQDPFDRMLIAQAKIEKVPVITADPVFGDYGVRVLW